MTDKPAPRPGGRSARVQHAVHQAVQELEREFGREAITVPAIAQRAGVTPSTIYRRWGDLTQLLADVAVAQLQPDAPPPDTGAFHSDMKTWLHDYFEEMSSDLGRTMLRDILGSQGDDRPSRCAGFCRQQIDEIRARALERGEKVPQTDQLINALLGPLMYRLLFTNVVPTEDDIERGMRMAAYKTAN